LSRRCPAAGAQSPPRLGRADAIDWERVARRRGVVQGCADGHEWVAGQIRPRQHGVNDGVANVADKTVAPVVEALAVACAAWERLDDRLARIETEVVGAERDGRSLRFQEGSDRATVGPAGDVD